MRSIRTAAFVLLFTSTAALAQTTAPVPGTAASATPDGAAQPASSDLTRDGKPRMKMVRAHCREEVKGEKLKDDARREAIAACIVKQRPDMAARVRCQMDPGLKGMEKTARHAAVQACVVKAKS